MRHLRESLLAQPGKDGQPLPSVRSLASHHHVTPRTMHRALGNLVQEGLIHVLERKGFFWGREPLEPEPLAPIGRVRIEDVRDRFLEDLRRGVFHPHKALPDPRSLAEIHGIGYRRMSVLLGSLVDQGWLVRRGRSLHVMPPALPTTHATVLVVTRCDAHGMLLLDSERETEFLRSIRIQARELGLEPLFAGWHETPRGGRLVDRHGDAIHLDRLRLPLLGVLVSTWLIQDPHALLGHLRRAKVPVSVWWEHPVERFPKARSGSLVGFNLSFGASAGWEAGRHLRSRGTRSVAFVSPFHASEWSKARLEGLRHALEGSGIPVEVHADSAWESSWHMRRALGGGHEAEKRLREVLAQILDGIEVVQHPDWVVVNDHAAIHLIELVRERGLPRPRILSFDNTSASEAHQFDSFEFHTDGMVRQMLQHVLHPKAKLFQDGGLHEMVGRIVVRSPMRSPFREDPTG